MGVAVRDGKIYVGTAAYGRNAYLVEFDPATEKLRIVLDVQYQTGTAMIPDGGYEAVTGTVAPQHGTFTFVQANKRYSFTTLEQGFDNKGRAGMIQRQTLYSSIKAVEALARTIGLQTYGFSTGTVAVVGIRPERLRLFEQRRRQPEMFLDEERADHRSADAHASDQQRQHHHH